MFERRLLLPTSVNDDQEWIQELMRELLKCQLVLDTVKTKKDSPD